MEANDMQLLCTIRNKSLIQIPILQKAAYGAAFMLIRIARGL